MKKLIAIDGNSLMHRAYWAMPNMSTKSGVPTGAVYGFINMLLKLLQYEPDYMVVAFDMHAPTFRHIEYKEYKAGRRETPDDLIKQFDMIKKMLSLMGIAVCECEGFEADDILGTFSVIANNNDIEALLVTGDRDSFQLVSDKTHVLFTKKGITDTIEYDVEEIKTQYGLTPKQMIDLKSLMGDNSDNIPGIPGIGEKTALKLLEKYSNLENVLEHATDEKGALQKKLIEGKESAKMSYWLGTIKTDAPVTLTLEECKFDKNNLSNASEYIIQLEMRSLAGKLPKGDTNFVKDVQASHNIEIKTINDESGIEQLVQKLLDCKRFAFDIGERFTVSVEEDLEYEIVIGGESLFDVGLDDAFVMDRLKKVFEDNKIKKIVFDAKKHMHTLSRYDVKLAGVEYDIMVMDYLINAINPADSLEQLTFTKMNGAKAGAGVLFIIYKDMADELEQLSLKKLYDEIELPLVEVLYDMEKTGVRVDKNVLEQLGSGFSDIISETEEKIYALAGEKFNILSTKQLGNILFEKLALPHGKKTKTGYSTAQDVLENIYDAHEIVPLILEYRTISKLKSTFIDGMISQLSASSDGRIHTSFNQTVTATGRISSTEPNLQNIPTRTETGREIRKAFVSSENNVLVGADYSQIELRLLAHMSADEKMIKAFNDGVDIHRMTASEVFSVEPEFVTKEQRSAAKAVNFGIVYGISDFGLAKNIGTTRKMAGEYIKLYFERYSGVERYMKESVEKCKENGYAITLMGRRRDVPELKSSNFNTRSFGERVAMNMPIQGTAADIIKLAMVKVYNELKENNLKAKLILQVHDELIIDTPEDEKEKVSEILSRCMQNVMKLSVPLTADIKSGKNWYETK